MRKWALVVTITKMEVFMKVLGRRIKGKEKGSLCIATEICMRGSGVMI